ncbi:MAG: sensor histidine kinase N-terminal domain-containing protein [Burkholderiales bacterium]|nr:sensor histidine kinase N-terminal domain-containing protein [Burkholderiales bacterium]
MTLQRRLLILLLAGAPLAWALAVGFALWRASLEINELFDTQQVRLAQQVAALLPSTALDGQTRRAPAQPAASGAAELEDLSVAVWNDRGELLLADREGGALPFDAAAEGFVDLTLGDASWRVYYLRSSGAWRVAVGQATEERGEVLRDLLASQLLPWLLMLPVLLAVIAAAVRRGLRPVREIAREVQERRADSLTPLPTARVPAELQPLLASMNDLFARIERALEHERRLTADAAHELRTPLAALRAQWEAAQLAASDAERAQASGRIGEGIERLGRLVSQLLALASAEGSQRPAFTEPVDWHRVVERALSDCLPLLDATGSEVSVDWPQRGSALPLVGDEALLATLLRNLVDNALRYAPPRSRVDLRFTTESLVIEDQGSGLSAAQLERLGDRFYRPAGQSQSGSGLGISIVQRVAELHGLAAHFGNRDDRPGLRVTIRRRETAAR